MAKGAQSNLEGDKRRELAPIDGEGGGFSRSCKHGGVAKHVLTIGKSKIWAGGYADIRNEMKKGVEFQLLLCVGGHSVASSVFDRHTEFGTGAAKVLQRLARRCGMEETKRRMVIVDWPDYGAPPVGSGWWQTLFEDLEKNVRGNVAVFCHGGHGRTGTALSILAWLNGQGGDDVVKWVRDTYCDHAVESQTQIKYLERLGIKTEAGGAKEFTSDGKKGGTKSIQKWIKENPGGGGAKPLGLTPPKPVSMPIKLTDRDDSDIPPAPIGQCTICNERAGDYVGSIMSFVCGVCAKKDSVRMNLSPDEIKFLEALADEDDEIDQRE